MSRFRDLTKKSFRSLDRVEMAYCHLSPSYVETSDWIITSGLDGVEETMRQSRALRTTADYAPLLCAFAILDQLGTCYRNKAVTAKPSNAAGVKKGIHYFLGWDFNSAETKAFYALRNGLVHDASLTCHAKDGTWYIFRYSSDESAPTIKIPATQWDGTSGNLNANVVTWVNVRSFTDKVSEAISKVREMHYSNDPDLEIVKDADEISNKYLFWRPKTRS